MGKSPDSRAACTVLAAFSSVAAAPYALRAWEVPPPRCASLLGLASTAPSARSLHRRPHPRNL